ncbi:MAG: flagellar motor protein MotA, partial [Ferrovibrio sp.]
MNHELSFMALILNADPIVQGVMAILVMASVGCWSITVEKLVRLAALRRAARNFEAAVKADALLGHGKSAEDVQGAILNAAAREKRDGIDAGESRYEFRIRLETAMR